MRKAVEKFEIDSRKLDRKKIDRIILIHQERMDKLNLDRNAL